MRTCRDCALLAALLLAPALASGQEGNLGQLLDQGATRLEKAELEALIPGTTTRFKQWTTGALGQASVDYRWENPPGGGSFRAYGQGMQRGFDGTGTWSISPDGRYCWDITFTREWKACRFVFRAGGNLYLSPSADKRDVPVTPVRFEK